MFDNNFGYTLANGQILKLDGAQTLTVNNTLALCDATSAAFTVTLPSASSCAGKVFIVKKVDSSVNAVTVDGNGSEEIDGATTLSLASQYDSAILVSDGIEFHIMAQ